MMAQDYDRFCALWARLEIREDSRFSFHDVEQRGAGERIGLCIWDLSNALHDKSVTGELPAWVGKVIPKFADPAVQRGSPEKGPAVLFGRGGDGGVTLSPSPSPSPSKIEMDASTRVLTSILTPGRGKPNHSKLLNAVMMSDFCDEGKMGGEEEEGKTPGSPLPKIVDRHDGGKGKGKGTGTGADAGMNKGQNRTRNENQNDDRRMNETRKRDDMTVHASKSKVSRDDRKGGGRGGGNLFGVLAGLAGLAGLLRPLALAAAGAVSVVVVQGVVAGHNNNSGWQRRRGMAGRW